MVQCSFLPHWQLFRSLPIQIVYCFFVLCLQLSRYKYDECTMILLWRGHWNMELTSICSDWILTRYRECSYLYWYITCTDLVHVMPIQLQFELNSLLFLFLSDLGLETNCNRTDVNWSRTDGKNSSWPTEPGYFGIRPYLFPLPIFLPPTSIPFHRILSPPSGCSPLQIIKIWNLWINPSEMILEKQWRLREKNAGPITKNIWKRMG